MQILDLSHTISDHMPVYPGDPAVQLEVIASYQTEGFSDHKLSSSVHVGTHVDAPAHMIEGGKQLKDYPLERFMLPAVCLDATNGFDPAAIKKAAAKNIAMLFYTGASEYFAEEKYWHEFPVLDKECMTAIIEAGVGLVGLDSSPDNEEGFPVHKTLLGADILLVENLANLKQLIGKTFEFQALPMHLEKDGAPVRAIAKVQS